MSNLTPIAPQCAASAPVTLIFKEKKFSLTGDGGTVKDAEGNAVFKLDAKKATMTERRTLEDAASGNAVGQLRKRRFDGIHGTVYIGTMDDEKKCSVKKTGIMNITNCNAEIHVGDTVVGKASGNWRAKSFSVEIDGNEVMTISRKTSAASVLMDADSYCIEIQPGLDTAFATLLTIALDELYHEA